MKKLVFSLLLITFSHITFSLVNIQAGFIPNNKLFKSGYGALVEFDPLPLVSVGTGVFSRKAKNTGNILNENNFVLNASQTIQIPVYLKINSPELPLTGVSVHGSLGYLFFSGDPSNTTLLNTLRAASKNDDEGVITAYKESLESTPFFALTVNYDVAPFIDFGLSAYFNTLKNKVEITQGDTSSSQTFKKDNTFYMVHLTIDF